MLKVQLEEDKKAYQLNKDFLECLRDEPKAFTAFKPCQVFSKLLQQMDRKRQNRTNKNKTDSPRCIHTGKRNEFFRNDRSQQKKNPEQ